MAHWLFKSEPESFGYTDLMRVGREGWDGVRSFQARNFMREMRVGDQAIFYHSNADPPGAAGVCKVVKPAEPDPTQFDPSSKYYDPGSKRGDPRWDWVTVAPVRALRFIPLDELRTMPELAGCRLLARGNRLSVLPLTDAEFDAIVRRGRTTPPKPPAAPAAPKTAKTTKTVAAAPKATKATKALAKARPRPTT
jgi:predicted RNA-binding protein with PUA-like domain